MKTLLFPLLILLSIATLNAQVLITPDNQGIGTSLPYSTSKLTLDGKDQTNEVLSLKADSSPFLAFYNNTRQANIGLTYSEFDSYFGISTQSLPIKFSVNGNQSLFLSSNGRVGVGYSPLFPNASLHVFTPEFTSEALRLQTTDEATNPSMTFYRQSNKIGQIGAVTGVVPDLEIKSNLAGIQFNTGGIAMKIASNGNIGMPNTDLWRKLNVDGRVNIQNGSLEFNSYGGNLGDILYSGGANYSPTWAAPPTPNIPKYAVSAKTTSGIILNTSVATETDLTFNSEVFDDGNILDGATFTAEHIGVYEVFIEIPIISVSQSSNQIVLSIYKNGALPAYFTQTYSNSLYGYVNNVNATVFGAVATIRVQYEDLFKVNKGDTLLFRVRNPSSQSQTIFPKITIKAIY